MFVNAFGMSMLALIQLAKNETDSRASGIDYPLYLCVGELVEVKSQEEILATLDENHSVSGLPFMPEMLQYCGKRFRVYRSAHKTADTIELFSIRRLANAVHLEELRCDGTSHGGCQAGCLLFWKECWLKRVPKGPGVTTISESVPINSASSVNLDSLHQSTRRLSLNERHEYFRCQATEMLKATTEVRRRDRWDPRFYTKDITSGNVSVLDFIRFGTLAALNAFFRRWFGRGYLQVQGQANGSTPSRDLNLQVGDWVRVRNKEEIERTLNRQCRNRGLFFDVEMIPYCDNGRYRVLRRVKRIINEKTGEMMNISNPCLILDGVTCSGNYSSQRMFSRRHEYLYWHEVWLERANADAQEG